MICLFIFGDTKTRRQLNIFCVLPTAESRVKNLPVKWTPNPTLTLAAVRARAEVLL